MVRELEASGRFSDEAVAEIAADLELSERLGLEILELGAGEPANYQSKPRYESREIRKVNLLTGESRRELVSVQL